MIDTPVHEIRSVGGYETVGLHHGPIFDDTDGMLPSRLHGYVNGGVTAYGSPVSTTYGYVHEGTVTITSNGVTWGPFGAGYYFSAVGEFTVEGDGSVALFERVGHRGVFTVGGPIESRGRLSYIDGCSDSLLIYPPRLGDPVLNILWFPHNVRQTMHLHPSVRLAIVVAGEGRAITPDGELPLKAGCVFRLGEMSQHCFFTESSRMGIITYHPDSDWGPTDANNPMLNRTLMAG